MSNTSWRCPSAAWIGAIFMKLGRGPMTARIFLRTTAWLTGGCDSVGVEDGFDVAQLRDAALQRVGVPHLDHEAVLHHRVHDGAACLEDVDTGLGEGAREVLQQPRAVPRV